MPRMTVLDMVQDILSDMNSDSVDSINDTTEALQVAQIIKTTYYEILPSLEYHTKELIKLTALASTATPTHMKLPDNVTEMFWVKYNRIGVGGTSPKYTDIKYVYPDEFINNVLSNNTDSDTIVEIVDFSGTPLLIKNNIAPSYWTSFDDQYIVFDSFDSAVESTLQQSKVQAYASVEPTFSISDTFTPDLPSKAFPFLLAESKSTCFATLGQNPNAKEEQKSRRQRNLLSRKNWRAHGGIRLPNYGR